MPYFGPQLRGFKTLVDWCQLFGIIGAEILAQHGSEECEPLNLARPTERGNALLVHGDASLCIFSALFLRLAFRRLAGRFLGGFCGGLFCGRFFAGRFLARPGRGTLLEQIDRVLERDLLQRRG